MAESWAKEERSVAAELQASREASKPKPPPDPGKAPLAEVATLLAEYASLKVEERDEAIAERDVSETVQWAQSTATDFEASPEEVSAAANSLIDAIGVDDYRFGQFIDTWQNEDPESAEAWLVQRQWENFYAAEDAQAEITQVQAQAAADHAAAMAAMTREFVDAHPDAARRRVRRHGPLGLRGRSRSRRDALRMFGLRSTSSTKPFARST